MMQSGMFGVSFTSLDGHHLDLDDEFAFSTHERARIGNVSNASSRSGQPSSIANGLNGKRRSQPARWSRMNSHRRGPAQ